MIFNYTNNYQFTTRLNINNQPIEVIDSTKLLGTVLSNDLCWDLNTANLVNKANGRMQLLRKVACSEGGGVKEQLCSICMEHSGTIGHSLAQIPHRRK